ncbi:hypothetical protein V5O48_017737, partial [Marasmius crinis-equi]
MPVFTFAGDLVEILEEYTYVGMTFKRGQITTFATSVAEPHYRIKAEKARKVAHAVLHVESMIGTLPPDEGRILYMGCVDPHLIYGCEIILDTSETVSAPIKAVQNNYLRRLLGLSKHSVTAVQFTETGLTPILYRRMQLALRYLDYALERPHSTYVYAAVMDSISLYAAGKSSWYADLIRVIERAVPPQTHPIPDAKEMQDRNHRRSFQERVDKGCREQIENELGEKFRKVYLLRERKEPSAEGSSYRYKTLCMRQYLQQIENAQHRKVFTKILAGDHPLAVDRLRWTDNHRLQVPYAERLCRLCRLK